MKNPDPRCKRNVPKVKKGKVVGYYGFDCNTEHKQKPKLNPNPAPYIDTNIYKEVMKPKQKPKQTQKIMAQPKPKPKQTQMPRELKNAELIKILQKKGGALARRRGPSAVDKAAYVMSNFVTPAPSFAALGRVLAGQAFKGVKDNVDYYRRGRGLDIHKAIGELLKPKKG